MAKNKPARLFENPALPAVASGFLALLLYAVTIGGTYVYDDIAIVRDDPRVHDIHQWQLIWKTDYFNGGADNLYRPIISTSYALQWQLHGDRPWIFHAINILLAAATAAAVAEFTRRALSPRAQAQSIALIAGLLFAAHPVHVEAVANIVGRAELLCSGCIFLGLILLIRRPLTLPRVLAIIGVGAVAVLSKEQGILQPLLWFLCVCLLWPVGSVAAGEKKPLQMFTLLTTWLWAGYLLLREHFLRFEWDRSAIDTTFQPLVLSQGMDRILMPVVLLGRYTLLLLWPRHLSPDYGGDVIGSVAHLSDPFLWIGFIAMLLWIIAITLCTKNFLPQRRRDAEKKENLLNEASSPRLRASVVQNSSNPANGFTLFCLLALAISYGMIGNIVTLIGTNFAERLLYLPSAFFLMAIATRVVRIPIKPRCLIITLVLLLASLRTVTAARQWNHPAMLFEQALANQPRSIQLALLLAQEYHHHGNQPGAQRLLEDLCRRYPNYWRVWMYRTRQDIDNHRINDAQLSLSHALKLKVDPSLWGLQDDLNKLQASTQPIHGQPK